MKSSGYDLVRRKDGVIKIRQNSPRDTTKTAAKVQSPLHGFKGGKKKKICEVKWKCFLAVGDSAFELTHTNTHTHLQTHTQTHMP